MGIKRIEETFAKLKAENKKAFIAYVMAGDGGIDFTEKAINYLESVGTSIIEIGVPFSDPVADGPVIAEAGIRALENNTNLDDIFEMTGKVRGKSEMPMILMTYFNPVLQYGIDKFYKNCSEKGVDGIIIPDMPIEEWDLVKPTSDKFGIALIPLVAPTSGEERIKLADAKGTGYIYTVTVAGVTGARKAVNSHLEGLLKQVKAISHLPVVAGFGISSHEQVAEIGAHCDGVVVGSKIVELLHNKDFDKLKTLING